MGIKEAIEHVSTEYLDACQQPFADHPLAEFIRNEGARQIAIPINRPELKVKGSAGQSNWAEVPWFGVFNPEITTTAKHGYYVVYLFSTSLEDVYLSLGQGVTAIREEFGRKAQNEMRRRAQLICDRIPEYDGRFPAGPISLGGENQLARDYDSPIAFYRRYQTNALPPEGDLEADLLEFVRLYDLLIERGGLDNLETTIDHGVADSGDGGGETVEERRRYVRHSRIERNTKVAKRAKGIHGYHCQGCGFDFVAKYGERGSRYIEAHHLIPLSTLPEGARVTMDPRNDFAVLCSNCHRIVHRRKPWLSLQELTGLIEENATNTQRRQ